MPRKAFKRGVVGGAPTPAPAIATIGPSGSYVSGIEGSGGVAPTASPLLFGVGSDVQPSCHLSVFRGEDVTSDMVLLTYGATANDGGINFAEVSVEGGAPVQLTTMVKHPTNPRMFGFAFKVNVTGRAYVYVRMRPVNGREVVERFLINGCGASIPAPVQEYWVDKTNGNDSWNGKSETFTGGSNGPWRTVTKALNTDGIGADNTGSASPPFRVVLQGRRVLNLVRPGEHECDLGVHPITGLGVGVVNGASVECRQKIIVRRAPGNTGLTWISKVNRGPLAFPVDWVELQGVRVSVENIPNSEYGGISIGGVAAGGVGAIALTQGSDLFHPDGPAGKLSYGYPLGGVVSDGAYVAGYFAKGNYFAIAESDVSCPDPCGGLKFVRASRGFYVGFAGHYTDPNQSNTSFWDVRWRQFGGSEGRIHTESELVVNTASYNSGANETTITFKNSPTLENIGPAGFGSSEWYLRALTGPKVGGGGLNDNAGLSYQNEAGDVRGYPVNADGSTAFDTAGWRIKSMVNATKTVVVYGNASGILTDNLVRCYNLGHPDHLAIYGCNNDLDDPNAELTNLLYQNASFIGSTQTSPWLCQAYAAPFAADGAAAVTITAANGSTSFSYSGVQSSAQLRAGSMVRNKATGQYVRVKSIDTGNGKTTGTGTFYDPVAVAWTSAACTFARCPSRVSLINMIAHKTTIDATPGYWNYSAADWAVRCPTFVGRNPQNGLMLFDTLNGTFDNRSCFGARNVTISGGIMQCLQRDTGTGAMAGFAIDPARNHVISTGLSNSVIAVADGAAGIPSTYSTYLGATTKKAHADDVRQAPWDIDGNVRTAGVSVMGAKVA